MATLDELKKASKEVFKAHPKASSLIATSDGSFFLPAAKNLAQDHARKKGLKVFEIDRDGAKEKEPAPQKPKQADPKPTPLVNETVKALENIGLAEMTVAEVTKWAESTLEAEALTAALQLVPTKGGKEAIEARLLEISK